MLESVFPLALYSFHFEIKKNSEKLDLETRSRRPTSEDRTRCWLGHGYGPTAGSRMRRLAMLFVRFTIRACDHPMSVTLGHYPARIR